MGKALTGLKKLAIITTHPIQYNAPVFKLLTEKGKIQIKVFYTWGEEVLKNKYDPGFGKVINWDIPLLEGYDYRFCKNTSRDPGSHHFFGIRNPDLIKDIGAWGPDAILVYGWNFESHLRVMRYFKKRVPVYFRGDSTLLDKKKYPKEWLRKFLLEYVYRAVDKAFYTGKENRRYFEEYGLKADQLINAPHVVDNFRFGQAGESMREDLKISRNEIVFLFAGKLEPKKDPLLLVEAFSRLPAGCARLIIAGNGILEEAIKDRIKNLAVGIRGNIILLPFFNQGQMPMLYKTADVFILPSKGPGETWGLAVNEAMAAGRAVIVSNKAGCYADLVREGENGFIINSGDISSLTEKMKFFVDNPGSTEIFGKCSTEIIKDFSPEQLCSIIENEILSTE